MSTRVFCVHLVILSVIIVSVFCEMHLTSGGNFDESKRVEEEILDILGINKPKAISSDVLQSNSATEFLWDVYKNINEEIVTNPENKDKARQTRSSLNFITALDIMELEDCNNIVTFISKSDKNRADLVNMIHLIFNIEDLPKTLNLQRAELKIFKSISTLNLSPESFLQINVFHSSFGDIGNKPPFQKLNILTSHKGWLDIDITSALDDWLLKRSSKFEFYIKVNILGGKTIAPESAGFQDGFGDEKYKPFITAYLNGPEVSLSTLYHTRAKRSIYRGDKAKFKFSGACQRLNLTINFADLGWQNWIMAPQRFEAYFCSGECNFPLGAGMNATNHAIVQTLMHLKHSHLPKPSCAPNKLKSIPVLYHLSKEGSNLKKYRNIVAESCGCQ